MDEKLNVPEPIINIPRCNIAKKNAIRKNGRYPGAAGFVDASSPLAYMVSFIFDFLEVPAMPLPNNNKAMTNGTYIKKAIGGVSIISIDSPLLTKENK